jgi:hypothetical protein
LRLDVYYYNRLPDYLNNVQTRVDCGMLHKKVRKVVDSNSSFHRPGETLGIIIIIICINVEKNPISDSIV